MLLFGLSVRESETVSGIELGSVFAKICNTFDTDGRKELFDAYHKIANAFADGDERDYVLSIGKDKVSFCSIEHYFDMVFEKDVDPHGVFHVGIRCGGYDGSCYDTIKFTRII